MNKSNIQKAVQYALVCAMVVMTANLLSYLSGFIFWFFGLGALVTNGLVFLIVFIVVMMQWKKGFEEITYGQAFKFGLMLIGFYVVIMFIYELLFKYLIAPNFNQELKDHIMNALERMHVPADKLDDTAKKFDNPPPPLVAGLYSLMYRVVVDAIILSIVAIFARKEKG